MYCAFWSCICNLSNVLILHVVVTQRTWSIKLFQGSDQPKEAKFRFWPKFWPENIAKIFWPKAEMDRKRQFWQKVLFLAERGQGISAETSTFLPSISAEIRCQKSDISVEITHFHPKVPLLAKTISFCPFRLSAKISLFRISSFCLGRNPFG